MSIITIDAMIAGCKPAQYYVKAAGNHSRFQSLWAQPGIPGAGSYSGLPAGAAYSSSSALVAGQIPHYDPGGGLNSYLARWVFDHHTSGQGWAMLCDRLWDNGGLDVTNTSAQTVGSVAFPSRGGGNGPLLALEISAATGANAPTVTVGYTNTLGVSGRTATNVTGTVASAAIGSAWLIGLQAGDTGVQSVQSVTLSITWTTGTMNLVAYSPLTQLVAGGNQGFVDPITGCFPRIYNGAVPYIMCEHSSGMSVVHGSYTESQG